MENRLIKLMSEFMFGKVSPDEFRQLRSEIQQKSDEELIPVLKEIWEDERIPYPLSSETMLKLLPEIERKELKRHSYVRWLKYASIILLPILLFAGLYRSFIKPAIPDMAIMADAGQKSHVFLPDGSEVWLNANSTLYYPSEFAIKSRKVRLAGEGYFNVATDERKEFLVIAGNIKVVVHGTKFNISSYDRDSLISVSLIEGSISVTDKDDNRLALLTPGQTLKVDKNAQRFDIIEEDTPLTALWSHYKCRIENASAEEMFRKIGYWYGLNIRLENNNDKYRYGFTIKNESFREFLELIHELTPLEYHINGEEVVIRYK